MIHSDDYYYRNGVGPYPQTPADDRDEVWSERPRLWPYIVASLAGAALAFVLIEVLTR